MKGLSNKSNWYTAGAVIGFIMLAIVLIAISWVFTAFMVWLISLCFGFNFSLLVATGVWLSLLLLSGFMNRQNFQYNKSK